MILNAFHKRHPLTAAIGLLLSLPAHAAPVNWIGTTDFWDVANNWTPALPTATDDVTINVPGLQTVTVRNGNYAVNTLNATNALAISGGALAINNTASLAKFSLSGGTLSGTGAVNISGAATWGNGTMTGSGTTTVNGGLTLADGTHSLKDGRILANNGTTTWSEFVQQLCQ